MTSYANIGPGYGVSGMIELWGCYVVDINYLRHGTKKDYYQ